MPRLDREGIVAIIDEIDLLEMTLEAVPTLTQLARMMVNVQHGGDPEDRDGIARLGFRRRGIDVDYDKGVTALRPCASGDVLDAAMAPEMVVEAVRWRLQRVSAVLSAAGTSVAGPPRRGRGMSSRPTVGRIQACTGARVGPPATKMAGPPAGRVDAVP